MKMAEKPLAGPGLTSYRLKGPFGWIMIGAKDPDDAMKEAARSTPNPLRKNLEIWNGTRYVPTEKQTGKSVKRVLSYVRLSGNTDSAKKPPDWSPSAKGLKAHAEAFRKSERKAFKGFDGTSTPAKAPAYVLKKEKERYSSTGVVWRAYYADGVTPRYTAAETLGDLVRTLRGLEPNAVLREGSMTGKSL